MCAAVALGNVVGKTQHLLVVAIVPLHGYFNANFGAGYAAVAVGRTAARGVEGVGVQHFFVAVDKFNKSFHAARAREVVFTAAIALVFEANAHAVVQKAQLAQTLGQNFVVEIAVFFENFGIGQKMHFGARFFGVARYAHERDFNAAYLLNDALLHHATAKLQRMYLAFAPHSQAQFLAQGIHARYAHAVQAA